MKFATRLQAQRVLKRHGHIFGEIMIGIRYCTDKVHWFSMFLFRLLVFSFVRVNTDRSVI
jgi:hypothetical protein